MTLAGHTFNKCGFKRVSFILLFRCIKINMKQEGFVAAIMNSYILRWLGKREVFMYNYEALKHYKGFLNSISNNYGKSQNVRDGHISKNYSDSDDHINNNNNNNIVMCKQYDHPRNNPTESSSQYHFERKKKKMIELLSKR
ncbi:hypothetical protein PFDG_04876 [Plasmodium falciparum Dd2]|uniref:Uncharacterized protein n=1 Tax=Plasmodium falciparum (isolate Dd2) TaxID=57267 RepID=A0A0L7M903_PLAF4|nr:hypothetical protein PFDG_04876 [Plasmodium falciparum Dd2]